MAEIVTIFDLTSSIIMIIPSTILLKNYFKTKLIDYLYFALFFIFGSLGLLAVSLSKFYELLILEQLRQWLLVTAIFLLFLHTVKILWDKPPKIIWYSGVIWYALLMFLTFFFKIFDQPDKAKVLFLELPHTFSGTHPFGAGVQTENGIIIISTSFNQLFNLYFLLIMVLLNYAYIKVKPISPTKRIIRAKRLWLVAWISFLIWAVIAIGINFLFEIGNMFILITMIIIAIIAFTIPEAMLISEHQILHAIDLYNRINELRTEKQKDEFGMPELVKYIQSLPSDLPHIDQSVP